MFAIMKLRRHFGYFASSPWGPTGWEGGRRFSRSSTLAAHWMLQFFWFFLYIWMFDVFGSRTHGCFCPICSRMNLIYRGNHKQIAAKALCLKELHSFGLILEFLLEWKAVHTGCSGLRKTHWAWPEEKWAMCLAKKIINESMNAWISEARFKSQGKIAAAAKAMTDFLGGALIYLLLSVLFTKIIEGLWTSNQDSLIKICILEDRPQTLAICKHLSLFYWTIY